MENRDLQILEEEKRLEQTIREAEKQLTAARKAAEGTMEEMMEAKREVRENTVHRIESFYSSEDFEALVELSQCMNPVTEKAVEYEEEQQKISRLERLMKTPYFARIDFRFEGETEAERIYIGRASLMNQATQERYVYDWRSPIASVFYRFMTGQAFYEAPCGRVEGEVELKRQYEIQDGRLEYFFDADVQINDEFLRKLLSQNTSPKMKAIVETIQQEQDVVIRDMGNDLLMVQGVAGSGKTSIALHRAAYLMYQGLQNRLGANSIMILSPNPVFERYISEVLPELGEENIVSVVFEDIVGELIRSKPIQPKQDFLEQMVSGSSKQSVMKKSVSFKTSEAFRKVLDRFVEEIPVRLLEFEDVVYEGRKILSRQALVERVLRRAEVPLGIRLEQLEDYVLEHIFGTGPKQGRKAERDEVRVRMQGFLHPDPVRLYRDLFGDREAFERLTEELWDTEAGMENGMEIFRYTRKNLEGEYLPYEDAIAAAYLAVKIYGADKYRNIRQVVIDEAQDYYPLQFEMFRLLFPNARFTVVGDVNQTLAKEEDLSIYKRIERILNKKKSTMITLDKSFRCTREILELGLHFLQPDTKIRSFNRSGDNPVIASFENREALLDAVRQELKVCREKGLGSIGLICKTEKNASLLYHDLKDEWNLQLLQNESADGLQGVFVTPVYMSKGLEFDGVIICDADEQTYQDDNDRKLLYVECTRALHRLSIFCEGRKSGWLPG